MSLFDERWARRASFPTRKKSDPGKSSSLKAAKKIASRSPSLPKKLPTGQEAAESTPKMSRPSIPTVAVTEEASAHASVEDFESVEVSSRENGSSGEGALDELDGPMASDQQIDPVKTKAQIDSVEAKIVKTKELIKKEQKSKEDNVNDYLKLAACADKQQLQRIKTMFEKKNQKSTLSIAHLQKKLEAYHKRREELNRYGHTGHKQAREVLRDMGHGLKGVGANIVDGITGFSGGVVDNIKGAKDSIMSKPKEISHLFKNKFGSADNIPQLSTENVAEGQTGDKSQVSTLPARYNSAVLKRPTLKHLNSLPSFNMNEELSPIRLTATPVSFKYGSDDDNSSITSGSGLGIQSNPPSNLHSTPAQTSSGFNMEPLIEELIRLRECNVQLQQKYVEVMKEYENYKESSSNELESIKTTVEEVKFHTDRQEEQINDMTELHQHEMTNLRQDISSMEEKIEYRLDERTNDINDILENCMTRISKMEVQQQQQQIISMEMVENVTFRTLLTKLLNVVLAILAVVLVFVSTAANMLSPFLRTRGKILSTGLLIFISVILYRNWTFLITYFCYIKDLILGILPQR